MAKGEGPPPARRLTPEEMMRDSAGIGPEVWDDPGLNGTPDETPGGAFEGNGMIGAMPGTSGPEITADVFRPHPEVPAGPAAPRSGPAGPVHQPAPSPGPTPPFGTGVPPGAPTAPALGQPPAPARPSWWNPKWTPVAVVGGLMAFMWWYNKKNP